MADIIFRRTGTVNPNGSVPGTLTIGDKTWPTIERGGGYTFVRQGTYKLLERMDHQDHPGREQHRGRGNQGAVD